MKTRYCAQCWEGENRVPADVEVEGRIPVVTGWMPYRGFLCEGHLEILTSDGAEFRRVRRLD